MTARRSLLCETNAKTPKGEVLGWLTGILYFAPADLAEVGNVCPYSTPGCREACLYTAGRGRFDSVQAARIRKTREFMADRKAFITALHSDVARHAGRAHRLGFRPAVRLNGTSDLRWERIAPSLFASFPDVQFYDYTKDRARFESWLFREKAAREWPKNYHLTFSRSEHTKDSEVAFLIHNGATVTVVTPNGIETPAAEVSPMIPPSLWNHPVGSVLVDGDRHDLRFLDRPHSLVLLRAKGRAKSDTSGFVRRS